VLVSPDGSSWAALYVAETVGWPTTVSFGGRPGRYVRVQLRGSDYLSLAEVEVMGRALPPGGVRVSYATLDGTATAGAGFLGTSGTLIFAPGQTAATIVVPVMGDRVIEPDETFALTLSNPVGAALARGSATGTIRNDDAAPVAWTNLVGVTVTGTTLTKTSSVLGWDSGASSVQSLLGDGFFEYTIQGTTAGRIIGLNTEDGAQDYADIDFGLWTSAAGGVGVYESGVCKATFGSYVSGDRFRVAVEAGTVKYYQNGVLFLYEYRAAELSAACRLQLQPPRRCDQRRGDLGPLNRRTGPPEISYASSGAAAEPFRRARRLHHRRSR
jgi:hypothetical protein